MKIPGSDSWIQVGIGASIRDGDDNAFSFSQWTSTAGHLKWIRSIIDND